MHNRLDDSLAILLPNMLDDFNREALEARLGQKSRYSF